MVASAALLLRERGVAGTSVTRVLAHSNGPRGSVGFHFPGGRAELVAEALRRAGGQVTAVLHRAREQGTPPAEVFAAICEHYTAELERTSFRAGCPVGAAAQEAYADADLGPVVSEVVSDWTEALSGILVDHGRTKDEAHDLATLCVGSLEGAIMLARVRRSTHPLEVTRRRMVSLLSA